MYHGEPSFSLKHNNISDLFMGRKTNTTPTVRVNIGP